MRNISPTHIKLLTVQANELPAADALAEAAFLAWSKDHPSVSICQVNRALHHVPGSHDANARTPGEAIHLPTYSVTITIMYDFSQQADAVAVLMHDLENAIGAWHGWIQAAEKARHESTKLTMTDMQIHMAQPLSKLSASFEKFRNW